MMRRGRFAILNGILLLTLLAAQWGRSTEASSVRREDFLRGVVAPFRTWTTSDTPIDAHEVDLLQPDAVLVRRYRSAAGQWTELAVIAGHRKRTIHTPGFCMAGGGWETLWQHSCTISIAGGRRVEAMRSAMSQDSAQVLVTYLFTDGDYCTSSLLAFQASQLFRRLRGQLPGGALVRIIVPIQRDQASAEQLSDDFVRATLPPILARIQAAHNAGQ